jgi:hypothetical protein
VKPSGIITLLTDFGLSDPYVGIMEGVILSIHPGARLVDITHGIAPGAVTQGAWVLDEARRFFPRGTVHLGVVDPGVGGKRRPVAIRSRDAYFVGPDNGLFGKVVVETPGWEAVHLQNEALFLQPVSPTFHGRDVFAPVAARLSRGFDFHQLGPPVQDLVPLPIPPTREGLRHLAGEVVRIDRFGNLITNIPKDLLFAFLKSRPARIRVDGMALEGIHRTFGDVPEGQALAFIDSSDHLAIAVNRGRACDRVYGGSGKAIGREVLVRKAQRPRLGTAGAT